MIDPAARRRILHVTHDMGVGGAEQVILQLVRGTDATRFESSIACTDGLVGPLGEALRREGFTVHRLARRPGFDRALVGALRRLIRAERIDVVHCHQYTPYSYGVLAAAFTGARVVFTEHGRFHPDRHSWKRRLVNRPLSRLTDATVAISAATREALVRHEWFPRRAIRVVHNGVAPPLRVPGATPVRERLGIEPDAPVLGTIARLDPIKNQHMMVEALAVLRERHPRCTLILAGDGPERDALERRVRELDLEPQVRFTGFVADVADHLDAIDVFLLTSWSEGTSMTLLEAMSFARAIVVTSVGGNVELLEDERSALFVPAGDTGALVQRIERLITDGALRARLGEAAFASYSHRFEPRRMIAAYAAMYEATGSPPAC